MGFNEFIGKLFGNKATRDMKEIKPWVDKIKAVYPEIAKDVYKRQELLELIDRKVGLNNTLFFITSTGYADAEPVDSPQYKIPGGEFHIERCSALLNLYLAAIQ